jgi:hypothetical protein
MSVDLLSTSLEPLHTLAAPPATVTRDAPAPEFGATGSALGSSPQVLFLSFCAAACNMLARTVGERSVTQGETMEEIGPVDYAIVAFPGNRFRGEIGPALADLVEAGTIRIIDIAFAGKNANGDVVAFELTELDPDVQKSLDSAGIEVQGLLNEDDLMLAAEDLEPDSSAAVIVWENVWARKVTQAMRDAGGVLLAFERLPHDVVQAAREWALEQGKA